MEFAEKKIDVSEMYSKEELIEKINDLKFDENYYWKIILVGNKKMEINTREILKYVLYQNVIKIKDETKLEIDLEELASQNNLRGIFVKTLLEKIEEYPDKREALEKALELGLLAFNK